MLRKQRIPDLVVIAVLGLLLVLLNYTGNIGIMSDYPFIFLLVMYFIGRAVTGYIINKYMDNGEGRVQLQIRKSQIIIRNTSAGFGFA
ncbi:MAG: hypothetical protein Q7U54_08135 [Bacteroidales bacterium]|nr:hypothetical protein [Bacteroidales bacterium]